MTPDIMTERSQTLYDKPKMINNEVLLKKGQCYLKENLVEFHDFIIVTPDIWKHFNSWYGSDWKIGRFLKKDRVFGNHSNGWVLELYPE